MATKDYPYEEQVLDPKTGLLYTSWDLFFKNLKDLGDEDKDIRPITHRDKKISELEKQISNLTVLVNYCMAKLKRYTNYQLPNSIGLEKQGMVAPAEGQRLVWDEVLINEGYSVFSGVAATGYIQFTDRDEVRYRILVDKVEKLEMEDGQTIEWEDGTDAHLEG